MKLEIDLNAEYELNITLRGPEAVLKPKPSQLQINTASRIQTIERIAPGINKTELRRATSKRVSKPKHGSEHVAPAPFVEENSKSADAPIETQQSGLIIAGHLVPSEIAALPQKQIDFYMRKLDEYKEIYADDKAKELAVSIVRQVAGII